MSPLVGLIIKQLPSLIPAVRSLVKKPSMPAPDDDRLAMVERSLHQLMEHSQRLEAKLRRMMRVAILATLLALAALIMVFVR
jgi:hypothetical protein